MALWTKNLEKLKERWDSDRIKKKGEEWVQKHKERLESEWEYLVKYGFICEDPKLPIKEGETATVEKLEEMGMQRGINGKYHDKSMGPIVRHNPHHNTCMNAAVEGYKKHMEEEMTERREKASLESLTKEELIPLIWKDYFPEGTDTQGEHSMFMIKKWLGMDKAELVALAKKGE